MNFDTLEQQIAELRLFAVNNDCIVHIVPEQKRSVSTVVTRIAPIFIIDGCNTIGVPLNGEGKASSGNGQEQ